jgi:hypothetical protein
MIYGGGGEEGGGPTHEPISTQNGGDKRFSEPILLKISAIIPSSPP